MVRGSFLANISRKAIALSSWLNLSLNKIIAKNNSCINYFKINYYLPTFFDCNKYIGSGFPDIADFPEISDLIVHLDRLNVDRAMVWHTEARQKNPMQGNKLLIEKIQKTCTKDRIIPSFVVTPHVGDNQDVMDDFLYYVEKYEIRSFHFFSNPLLKNENIEWKLLDIVPVFHKIKNINPVLFIDLETGKIKINQLRDFSEIFPEVRLIVHNCSQRDYPHLFDLMDEKSNIFLDTTFLYLYQSIEYVINRFGVERLIFGGGYKSNNGATIATLVYSDINSEQRIQIAHGNLERLLKIRNPLPDYKPIIGDQFWHKFLRREKLDCEIIDVHSHLFFSSNPDLNPSSVINLWCSECTSIERYIEHAIHSMEALGIKTKIIAGFESDSLPPVKANNYLEGATSTYKKYFKGFLNCNPNNGGFQSFIENISEYFSRDFYVGFKFLNDYWKIPVTDKRFYPIWKYADSNKLPILLHTWQGQYDSPELLEDIAPKYPNAIFILGHSGGGRKGRIEAEKLAVKNSNVYLEWCGTFYDPTDWRELLGRIGNKKLVYGSDSMYHYPAYELGRLLSLDVPDENLIPILGENMSAILKQRVN